ALPLSWSASTTRLAADTGTGPRPARRTSVNGPTLTLWHRLAKVAFLITETATGRWVPLVSATMLPNCSNPVPRNLTEVTSKALPDTEIDAAIDPVAVSPTSTAATAAAGTITVAKRRHRTFPVVATQAGWAGGVAGAPGAGFSTDMTATCHILEVRASLLVTGR